MQNIFNQFKKIIVVILFIALLTVQIAPVAVQADDTPTAPTAPTAPAAPTLPDSPQTPFTTPTPTDTVTVTLTPTPTKTPKQKHDQDTNPAAPAAATVTPTPSPTPAPGDNSSGNQNKNGTTDPFIQTGNATNTGVATTVGNSNTGLIPDTGNSTGVINSGNGSNSTNNGSVGVINNNTGVQTNTADVSNGLTLGTTSGNNSASDNVGTSTIKTGDANTTGTVITGVNTNVDGVGVSEFNIADDHTGDIILDFPSNCISGCGGIGSTQVVNTGNGSGSTNRGDIESLTNNDTFQTNTATVGSDLTLTANSGENKTNRNTGGDNTIETGDANVAANALTFVNNNLAGNVLFGVVNIFGNLVGDIILPDSAVTSPTCSGCSGNTIAANVGNASGSTNNSNIDGTINDTTFQTNTANIDNNLILDGNTGGNTTSRNTNGDNYVQTGNTNMDAHVLNIANNNVDGGTWWLAIVNKAGQWVGQIMGAPDGSNMIGSEGTQFVVNADGSISAINTNNGSDSTNTAHIDNSTNNTTVQTNTATVTNNLNLSANTGNNNASDNTGGANTIKTGDAQVIANLVNFVNNNISGKGKLVVTLVNVFGSWMGDLVTPGHPKELKTNPIADTTSSNNQNTNNNSNTNSNNSSSSSSGTSTSVTSNGNGENTVTTTSGNAGSQGNVLAVKTGSGISSAFTGLFKDIKSNKQKQTVHINLVWALTLLPFGLLFFMRKRIFQILNLLPKKSI